MNQWKVITASALGFNSGTPKDESQDCINYHSDNQSLIAIISDGAGSALFSKTGAEIICKSVCEELSKFSDDIRKARKNIFDVIAKARTEIEKTASKSKTHLSDYHATLIGVIANNYYGFMFHIGDGVAIASQNADFTDFIISKPENGDYINETYFLTMNNWEEHLRIIDFENPRYLCLMSDGLTGFAFSNDYDEIKSGFLAPISRFLDNNEVDYASKALFNTISSSNAHNINSDDKSIIWAKFED